MVGAIIYINFSGYYETFYEWKEKNKSISRDKGILKYLTKECVITSEEDAEKDEDKLKIY